MFDEPDSMLISVNIPSNLVNVSNGRLRSVVRHKNKTTTYDWFVSNPVNNNGANINIGDYVHFSEVFHVEKGPLNCYYYVLRENLGKARIHFKQVPVMLAAFEYWFGPYPLHEDNYKLVNAPYLGMERQGSVTYGNGYRKGFRGIDQSGSEYVPGTRRSIRNERPIEGIYNVNFSGSGDMYPKGGNMLHTLRQIFYLNFFDYI